MTDSLDHCISHRNAPVVDADLADRGNRATCADRTNRAPRGTLPRHGARRIAPPGGADDAPLDAETVIQRLEEAGRTLLALPHTGPSTRLRLNTTSFVRHAIEACGWDNAPGAAPRLRLPTPDAAHVSRMDQALGWLGRIPDDRFVIRRVVGCRALVHPLSERYLYPWRRIGTLLGADHKAVQRWHAQGIDMIVSAVNRRA